ncbi:MAG: metal ABC transporter solute-binding protein [Candidatus Saccharimonadales bacterium]
MAKLTYSSNQSIRLIYGAVVLIGLVVVLYLLISPSKAKLPTSNNSIRIVAAENFWGNIAGQIAGKHAAVTSIVTDPTADPHLYESNAQNGAAIARADIVIVNGLGYDQFMNKLLAVTRNQNQQVITVSKILGQAAEDVNPHFWYDVNRLNLVAKQIEQSLEIKDPTNKATYRHNLSRFNQSLSPILKTIDQIKNTYSGSPVAYTERVPGYLLQAAGLEVKTPISFAKSIEDGSDPSPGDIAAMNSLILNKRIKVLLYNAQATSPVTQHVRELAISSGIPVVGVTETLPASEPSYQSWQQHQVNQLSAALVAKH